MAGRADRQTERQIDRLEVIRTTYFHITNRDRWKPKLSDIVSSKCQQAALGRKFV
jgi:hypothetical protein